MGAPTRARYLRKKNALQLIGILTLVSVLASVIGGQVVGGFYVTGTWDSPSTILEELVKGPREFSGLYVAGIGTVVAVVAAVVVGGWLLGRKVITRSSWVDAAARHMASLEKGIDAAMNASMKTPGSLPLEGALVEFFEGEQDWYLTTAGLYCPEKKYELPRSYFSVKRRAGHVSADYNTPLPPLDVPDWVTNKTEWEYMHEQAKQALRFHYFPV